MKRWERGAFILFALAVTVTGAVYLWMKYFVESDDPFAVVNHPWEPAMLHLHVLASPPFVLIFGMILNSHILKKLRATRPNRTSGLASLVLFAVMAVTGYLLQVTTNGTALQALVALHVASGALFALTYTVHLVIAARLTRRVAATAAVREVA